MRSLKILLSLFLSILFFNSRSFAQSEADAPQKPRIDITTRPWYHYIKDDIGNIKIPSVKEFKLNNGIPVYFVFSDSVPVVNAQIFIEGGAFEVADEKLGLQSLWGDMVTFSGSDGLTRDALSKYLDERATAFAFKAELERSYFSIRSLAHFFGKDLTTLFSVLESPRFYGDDLEILRTRTLKALDERDQNPATWASLGLSQVYWKGTLRARYATMRTVKNIQRQDLIQWHKKMWRAERFTIAVSGSIDFKKLKEALEKTFGKLTFDKGAKVDLSPIKVLPTAKTNSVYLLPKDIPQTTLFYKAPGVAHSSEDYYALRLFDFLLGGDSFNSELTQIIRTEKGWAYTAYSSFETDDFTGSVFLFTQTANTNLPQVIPTIDKILAEPQKFITKPKIEQAKTSLKNKFVFLFESPSQYLQLYLRLKWDGLSDNYLENYIKNLSKVSEADVLRVAQKYYRPENFTILVCGPKNVYEKRSALRPNSATLLEIEK
ncbi:MAG: hypothetical protein LDLANPLL_02099 [Turneriella sp.]|nr:hypothetical protein [Turneriella sp.]